MNILLILLFKKDIVNILFVKLLDIMKIKKDLLKNVM